MMRLLNGIMGPGDGVKLNLSLAALTGILLGISFPPLPTGVFAVVAFVPLFILLEGIESYGSAFRYSYLAFFLFNLITLYWTGGFTHGKDSYLMLAGGILLVAHPIFFCVPVLAGIFIRRHLGFKWMLFTFPFLWVSFEYLHSISQISFPWIVLGNSQTYDLAVIQFASFTGVYGVSYWIIALNVLLFILYAKLALGEWKSTSPQAIRAVLGILLLYLLPKLYGSSVLNNVPIAGGRSIRVGIVQPNIDPFEKWQDTPGHSMEVLQKLTARISAEQVDLIVWPETAIPFYILRPGNEHYFESLKNQVDSLGVPLLTGIPDTQFYNTGDGVPLSSKVAPDGQRYDTFNSSMLLEPHSDFIQKYAKTFLVPFAERVPFSEQLSFLNAMQWNLGLGGWEIGRDSTVFVFTSQRGSRLKFSNLICYESIFPGFAAKFVQNGAEFLTVITNDSWWGNTSGAYQHEQIAVMRAVENRRWVIQCANGGISCAINPRGKIVKATQMYTQALLTADIEPLSELTFYSRQGDWLAEMCIILSAFSLVSAFGGKIYGLIRRGQVNEIY